MTIVSAYPLSPAFVSWDPAVEHEVLHGLAGLDDVSALEVPWIEGIHPHDPDWFLANAPAIDLVLTPLPLIMRRIAAHPAYGIASPDAEGRALALADLRRVAADVAEVAARSAARVTTVEVHTAPRAVADADALRRSLAELAELDWSGAQIVIEHCDAHVPGQEPEKGFLSLEGEIAAIREVDGGVGLWMNWGRSAIETRDPDAVAAQVASAAESGVLRGLVLSGASDHDGPYGRAWIDAHHPFASVDPDAGSLLTDERIRAALSAAGADVQRGIKVSRRLDETSPTAVLALAQRHLDVLRDL